MDLKERIQELCKQKNVSMNKVETDKCYRILRTKRGQNKDIFYQLPKNSVFHVFLAKNGPGSLRGRLSYDAINASNPAA